LGHFVKYSVVDLCFKYNFLFVDSNSNKKYTCFFLYFQGWLPQAAIDQAMGNVLTTYFSLLLKRYAEIMENGLPLQKLS